MVRIRLDQLLVSRGLAPTRSRARDLIARGCVAVDGVTAAKAGQSTDDSADVVVTEEQSGRISRGGLKLAAALDAFDLAAEGRVALDIGASTGGFTDTLLQRGARRVYAVDVGRGQLHPSLGNDPRVVSLEAVDARSLSSELVPEPVDAVVADVSFISLTKVLAAPLALARDEAWLIALIKPQFEAGRLAVGKGGIVRSAEDRTRAIEIVRSWLAGRPGWTVVGVIPSPIPGGAGNEESLIGAIKDG
jgi:23S rRNA (cytidine1920-2'-O)/16S rRNA (cytidine1409-2'-O)-methyltransferase